MTNKMRDSLLNPTGQTSEKRMIVLRMLYKRYPKRPTGLEMEKLEEMKLLKEAEDEL